MTVVEVVVYPPDGDTFGPFAFGGSVGHVVAVGPLRGVLRAAFVPTDGLMARLRLDVEGYPTVRVEPGDVSLASEGDDPHPGGPPCHAPVGESLPWLGARHDGHLWDCTACLAADPTLDCGRRGCSHCRPDPPRYYPGPWSVTVEMCDRVDREMLGTLLGVPPAAVGRFPDTEWRAIPDAWLRRVHPQASERSGDALTDGTVTRREFAASAREHLGEILDVPSEMLETAEGDHWSRHRVDVDLARLRLPLRSLLTEAGAARLEASGVDVDALEVGYATDPAGGEADR